MYWILIIVVIVILYFVIKSKRKSDDNHLEEYDVNGEDSFTISIVEDHKDNFDKQSSLSKEATKLKKEGDLEGAVKKIDEAISIEPSNTLVYKKAYYLQLDNKFDEAWEAMSSYTEIANEALLNAKDWGELRATFLEYSDTLLSEAKLLKKEKKVKEYAYYCPHIEYCEFLAHSTYPLINFKKLLDDQKNGSISKRRKIKHKDIDLDKFDLAYRVFITSNEDKFTKLYDASQSSDPFSYTRHLHYGTDEYDNKFHKINRESEKKALNAEKYAFKALSDIWSKGIALNDKCYKAAENKL